MRVIWLASWYPNPIHPFDGDFIQRHARAVSLYTPVTVFYVSQLGEYYQTKESKIIERVNEGVVEKIIFFSFKKTGLPFWDRIIYNWKYYNTYKKTIKDYFSKEDKPDLIHVHVPMKAGMIGKWIKRRWGIPYIISEHSSHYIKGSRDDFFKKSFFHWLSVKKIFKNAIAVTNVSENIAETLKAAFSLPDIRVVHNTVDTKLFYYQNHDVSKFRFIHVSTLIDHQKNVEGMVSTISKLSQLRSDFEVVIVGPASTVLKEKITALRLNLFIRFTGEVSYPEVAREMHRSSAFLLFSRYENFPCVIVEALCCGLPVIATDTGGVKEAVNEKNGVLVEPENEKQLLVAMNTTMNEYHRFNRKEIAEKATAAYSYKTIGESFFNLYKEKKAKLNGA